jgi:adenosylcobinamide-GDP ribazoletransferase
MMAEEPFRAEFNAVVDDLKTATLFLTRVPARWFGPGLEARPDFRRAARVFPVVGAMVGLAGGLVLVIAARLGENLLLSAGLAVLSTIVLTNALHEDGLADTVDGFAGGATVERKLEIMHDSRIGTYGAAALVFSILFRVGALMSIGALGPFRAAWALVAAEAVSRAGLVRLWHELPAARAAGLAADTGPPDERAMVIALALAAAIVAVVVVPSSGFTAAVMASVIAVAVTYLFIRICAHEICGRTGDTLGACQQIAGIAFLIGLAAFD